MEVSPDEKLYQAVLKNDLDAVSSALSQGANPNRIASKGKTSLGEAAYIGNIEIVKLLINASEIRSCITQARRQVKCHKRKLKHNEQQDGTVVKCKTLNDRTLNDFHFEKYETIRAKEYSSKADKNQGYFVFVHSEASSSDKSNLGSLKSQVTPPLTPSPQADLEWDEDIGNVAPSTSEDEIWSTIYKWYAAILETTGAAIASVSVVNDGINQQDVFSKTALHYAAIEGHINVVQLLIEAGCKVDSETNDGSSPLHGAVMKNYTDIVKLLIKAGSNVNKKMHRYSTPLHFAVSRAYLDLVKILVTNGAYLEARDNSYRTPLYIAANKRDVDVLKYLIDAGANVNSEEINGYTPLCEAIVRKFDEGVKLLLSSGARIIYSHNLLHKVITQKEVGILKILLNNSEGLNIYDDEGDTPLLLATKLSQIEIVKALLNKGVNVNISNRITGSNALHMVVDHVSAPEKIDEFLKTLFEYNIDMNATSVMGDTPLNRAMLLHKYTAAVFLIRYGADVNQFKINGLSNQNNLSIACNRENSYLATMLIKAGHSVPVWGPNLLIPEPSRRVLYHFSKEPLSLSDLCRIKIRSSSPKTITLIRYVSSLPLPKSIKRYLMMDDETCTTLDHLFAYRFSVANVLISSFKSFS